MKMLFIFISPGFLFSPIPRPLHIYVRSNGVFGFRCYEEKKPSPRCIANRKSNAKIENPPTLCNKTHLNIDTTAIRVTQQQELRFEE